MWTSISSGSLAIGQGNGGAPSTSGGVAAILRAEKLARSSLIDRGLGSASADASGVDALASLLGSVVGGG